MSFLTTLSSKTPYTLFHYSPVSSTSSTRFHYAPLSSARLKSLHTTTSSQSTTTLIHPQLPAPTSQPDSLLTSSTLSPPATKTCSPDHPLITDPEILNSSMGFTVIILTILGLLLALTIIIWWTESHACEDYRNSESNKLTSLSHRRVPEPVSLGILMQSSIEAKKDIRCCERLRGWFLRLIAKARFVIAGETWTNSVVDILRAELDMDAEEGLLLPVQESERIGAEKDELEFKFNPVREC